MCIQSVHGVVWRELRTLTRPFGDPLPEGEGIHG